MSGHKHKSSGYKSSRRPERAPKMMPWLQEQAFGVRLPLDTRFVSDLGQSVMQLSQEGSLPSFQHIHKRRKKTIEKNHNRVVMKHNPAIQVLPRKFFRERLENGKLGLDKVEQARHGLDDSQPQQTAEALIRNIHLRAGQNITLEVESDAIAANHELVNQVMEHCKINDYEPPENPAVAEFTIGKINKLLSLEARNEIMDILLVAADTVHPLEDPIGLQPWDIYPKLPTTDTVPAYVHYPHLLASIMPNLSQAIV
jgi:hypothetical protein